MAASSSSKSAVSGTPWNLPSGAPSRTARSAASAASRADLDVTLKQAESGLNLADYLEKKEPAPAAGAK